MGSEVEMDAKELGNRVKAFRQREMLTQAEFALLARISRRLVGVIEEGRCNSRLDTVNRVLEACALEMHIETGMDGRSIIYSPGHITPMVFGDFILLKLEALNFKEVNHVYLRRMPDHRLNVENSAKQGAWPATVVFESLFEWLR